MGGTSKTGLVPTQQKTFIRYRKKPPVHLKADAVPAPFSLKPFAGLYNPYPYGCSLLCNHPADTEARDLLKRAKNTWATEGKSLLLADEIAAIRAGLERLHADHEIQNSPRAPDGENGDSVPEELFRRYTETDSRPLTPTPTVASVHTKASNSRRCMTPDPMPTSKIKEKTQLILDLRRSHSQETISWFGSSQTEPPIIRIQHVPTRPASPDVDVDRKKSPKAAHPPHPKKPKSDNAKPETKIHLEVTPPSAEPTDERQSPEDIGEEEEGALRRRGKRRHRRHSSRGPPAFQTSVDPETQIATIGIDSHNPSARPSLVPNEDSRRTEDRASLAIERKSSLDVDSYLDKDILRQLRRELNEEVVDNEFNFKRKKALEEAMKTVSDVRVNCDELRTLQKELRVPVVNGDFWLSLPRTFTMSPLEYIKDHVSVTSSRKLLYNYIFNRNKIEYEEELEERKRERKMAGTQIPTALDEMMGQPLTEAQRKRIKGLIDWPDGEPVEFKTFCGLCALCERLLAPEVCPQLPSKKADPCHEIEIADFESLERRLKGHGVDANLLVILRAIKNS